MAPVACGVEIAQSQLVGEAELDLGDVGRDFAGDELKAAAGAFVVEEDAAGGVQSIGLAVVARQVEAGDLGNAISRARMERRQFGLRRSRGLRRTFRWSRRSRSALRERRFAQAESM